MEGFKLYDCTSRIMYKYVAVEDKFLLILCKSQIDDI